MKHKWEYDGCCGVTPYSGRPAGVDESWTCKECGCQKSKGPQNTSSGKSVTRWTYRDADGYDVDELPECNPSGNPYITDI